VTISKLIKQSHKTAVEKGWWQEERPFGDQIALMHSELSEALEEYRNGHDFKEMYYRDDGKPEGIPSELADVLIRIADTCGRYDIDLEHALKEKLKFNKTRPHRHGNKVI